MALEFLDEVEQVTTQRKEEKEWNLLFHQFLKLKEL